MALDIYWSKRADKNFDRVLEYLTFEWEKKLQVHLLKKYMISLIF